MISSKTRILFVDDEPSILAGLRRAMHGMRGEWDMEFCLSVPAALAALAASEVDVLVTDMQMPRVNGSELLIAVKQLYPRTIRFVLSGYAERASVMRIAGLAHQYISKPCDSTALKMAISRSVQLKLLLGDAELERQVGDIESLPTLPAIYQEIVDCLQQPDAALADVARIISRDVAMTATILKLANSAFFGAGQSFRTAERAVSFLGLDTISGLVLARSVFNEFKGYEATGLKLEALWQHSVQCAAGARALALAEGWSSLRVEEAFLAAILHDLGHLILAMKPHVPARDDPDGHAALGAYLLSLWGFSDTLIEAVAFHHTPSKANSDEFGLPGLLHVASELEHFMADTASVTADAVEKIDKELEVGYLESIGQHNRLEEWLKAWPVLGEDQR